MHPLRVCALDSHTILGPPFPMDNMFHHIFSRPLPKDLFCFIFFDINDQIGLNRSDKARGRQDVFDSKMVAIINMPGYHYASVLETGLKLYWKASLIPTTKPSHSLTPPSLPPPTAPASSHHQTPSPASQTQHSPPHSHFPFPSAHSPLPQIQSSSPSSNYVHSPLQAMQ